MYYMNIIPRIPRSVCLKDGENEKEDPPAPFSPHLFHSQHAGDFIVDSYKRKIPLLLSVSLRMQKKQVYDALQ